LLRLERWRQPVANISSTLPFATEYLQVHPNRMYATDGGLIAYGPITVELYRSAAGYVDRIIKHRAKPADLPVQQMAKYELDINLQTARAIDLNVPPALLIFADRVIA